MWSHDMHSAGYSSKLRLTFKKQVLQQKYPDKDVFLFSKNRKQFSVYKLATNLRKLISDVAPVPCGAHAESLNENEDLDILT